MPSKTYSAVLTQGGTTPPQELFAKSDFLHPIVWDRVEAGTYVGTCDDAFDYNKTIVIAHSSVPDSGSTNVGAYLTGAGEITLILSNESAVNKINLVITEFL